MTLTTILIGCTALEKALSHKLKAISNKKVIEAGAYSLQLTAYSSVPSLSAFTSLDT
jgi:hypothetical protein